MMCSSRAANRAHAVTTTLPTVTYVAVSRRVVYSHSGSSYFRLRTWLWPELLFFEVYPCASILVMHEQEGPGTTKVPPGFVSDALLGVHLCHCARTCPSMQAAQGTRCASKLPRLRWRPSRISSPLCLVGNGGMDPYSSPYIIIPNNSPHNPFPHSLESTRIS